MVTPARITAGALSLLLFLSGPLAGAEEPGPEPAILSLRDCVVMALDGNPDVAAARLLPAIASESVRAEEGVFDPVLSASLTGGKEKLRVARAGIDKTHETGIFDTYRAETFGTATGLEGTTPIGLGYSLLYSGTMDKHTFSGFQSEYRGGLGFSISQPLLRDGGTGAALAALRIAEKGRRISELEWRRFLMAMILTVSDAYWDLVFASRTLELETEFLHLAETLHRENEKRFEAGTLAAVEVIQSRAGVAARRDSVFLALKALATREVALKILVLEDPDPWLGRPVVPGDPPATEASLASLRVCVREGLVKRPEVHEARARLERSRINERFARNQLLPSVDLEGGVPVRRVRHERRERPG